MKPRCVGNQYEIQYRCPGISIPIKERFATKEEAEVRIAEVKLAKKRKNLVPPRSYLEKHGMAIPRSSTVNVRSLLENYVRVYGVNNWSDSTLSGHLTRMEHYIFPYMGNRDIRTITALDLDSFYDQLQHTKAVVLAGHPDTGKCVGHTVIEKIHSLLRCAFHQAVKWQMIERNPADYATLPRFKTAKRDVWTPEEAKHAVELCTDPRLKLAMLVAIGCSMRVGEICGLTWDHIEITPESIENDTSVLHVVQELKRSELKSLDQLKDKSHFDVYKIFPSQKSTPSTTRLVLKAPKTESSVRDIFIPRFVAEAILEHKESQQAWKEDIGDQYTDFNLMLTQANGYPVDTKFIESSLRNLIEENNLKPVVFHSLRHTSVSMKLSLCGDIKAVQGDTGHSQANMVTDVYAHINNKDRQRLAVMVNDSFFEKDEDQEMYEKCTKPDEQNDTKSDSNHSALSPEISTIVDALQQNQGMAAAIMGMIKCMA